MSKTELFDGHLMMDYNLGIDVGGTFTDVVLVDEVTGAVQCRKVPSTPANPAEGIESYFESEGVPLGHVGSLVHGSTIAVNAIIEGRGARLGLITNHGFKNRLDIQRVNVERDFDFNYRKPQPLISLACRREIPARTAADGSTLRPVNREEVERLVDDLVERERIEVLCVCLVNSYRNPHHEVEVRAIVENRYPDLKVVCSSDMGEVLEYERFSTCAVNAFLLPVIDEYLTELGEFFGREGLRGDRFMIMQGNGGIARPDVAGEYPALTIESGPAGGVMASHYLGQLLGEPDLLTLDMGGTSTDVCLIRGGDPYITTEYKVGGHPLKFPLIDIHSVGAGGGSIAWIDEIGRLHVGPRSAGASPGPACYGKGGREPTISDAHAVLGRLRPEFPLGGDLVVKPDLAQEVIAPLAANFGLDAVQGAARVIRIANENMANALRVVSVQKGLDPRGFTLVAYGGAGPMHAGILMKILGIPRCIVPRFPGAHSALGLAISDVRHDFVQSIVAPTATLDPDTVEEICLELERRGHGVLDSEGVDPQSMVFERRCDMRYIGQAYVPVILPLQVNDRREVQLEETERVFHQLHRELYKHGAENEPTEIVSIRVTALGRQRKISPGGNAAPTRAADSPDVVNRAGVYFEDVDRFLDSAIYERDALHVGHVLDGPALVAQTDALVLIYPGQQASVDQLANLLLHSVPAEESRDDTGERMSGEIASRVVR